MQKGFACVVKTITRANLFVRVKRLALVGLGLHYANATPNMNFFILGKARFARTFVLSVFD